MIETDKKRSSNMVIVSNGHLNIEDMMLEKIVMLKRLKMIRRGLQYMVISEQWTSYYREYILDEI